VKKIIRSRDKFSLQLWRVSSDYMVELARALCSLVLEKRYFSRMIFWIQNHSSCQKWETYLDSSPSSSSFGGVSTAGVVSIWPSDGVCRHLLFGMKRRVVENFRESLEKKKETADFDLREIRRRVWISHFYSQGLSRLSRESFSTDYPSDLKTREMHQMIIKNITIL